METYRQTLQTPRSMGTYKRFIILGILYLVFGVFNILKQNGTGLFSSIIWFISGAGFIITSLIEKNNIGKYFIEFNEDRIEARFSYFSSFKLEWNEIKEIKTKPMTIVFLLNSNRKKELTLGTMSYANVIEFKSRLKEFAIEKEISIV